MSLTLRTEHHLEFLSIKGGCIGSSESTLVKIPHCWKAHVMAHSIEKAMLRTNTFLYIKNLVKPKIIIQNFSVRKYNSC